VFFKFDGDQYDVQEFKNYAVNSVDLLVFVMEREILCALNVFRSNAAFFAFLARGN
jgi:hypothetical protein